jgi:hypothetical protein
MFRNYLVTALRNIARHKLYSFINIAGLAVGLACAILIILFVRDELSYDKWVPGSERLYRVETSRTRTFRHQHGADYHAADGSDARPNSGGASPDPPGV